MYGTGGGDVVEVNGFSLAEEHEGAGKVSAKEGRRHIIDLFSCDSCVLCWQRFNLKLFRSRVSRFLILGQGSTDIWAK